MNPYPLARNPFAVLGLPEWPDLDDETVHAAWQVIAAETHPNRPDGGNLARFTQATAAYAELCCPWGRSEAYADLLEAAWAEGRYADLLEAAWAEGRYDDYPDHYPPGYDPGDELPPAELGPVPLPEVLHLLAEIPARFRRGHPCRLLIRAAVTAGLCAALLALFPGRFVAVYFAVGLIVMFPISAWADMAPPARPVRRRPAGKN